MKAHETVSILLVEDDDIAAETVRRAFKRARLRYRLHWATDGIEALQLLRCPEGSARIENPRIVLLDLRMPRVGGIRFLETLRGDPELSDTVVFVLSTSDQRRDRNQAYAWNVAGYIVKSELEYDLRGLVDLIEAYVRVNEFPSSHQVLSA